MQLSGDDASDPVGEGTGAVHEDPETREGIGGLQDTTEDNGHHREDDDDRGGSVSIGHGNNGHVCECTGVDEELDDEEKNKTLALRILDSDNGVVEAGKDEDTSDDLVWDLDDNVGDDESLPGVRFAGTLADFVERSLGDKEGLNLKEVSYETRIKRS